MQAEGTGVVGRLGSWQGEQCSLRHRGTCVSSPCQAKALVGLWAGSPVFWKGGEGNQSWVEQGWFRAGMCQVACDGPRELPSPTCAGANRFLPGNFGLGSQSAGVFLLQVWAFLSGGAPSLQGCERHQMQAVPCQEAPEVLLEGLGLPRWEAVAPVGVGFGGGRWGVAKACSSSGCSRLLPSLLLHNAPEATTAIA